jgi:hypothetical protein
MEKQYPHYRISTKGRKYSPTPVVRVDMDENGKEIETIVLVSNLKKKQGDAMSAAVVEYLNSCENVRRDFGVDILKQ